MFASGRNPAILFMTRNVRKFRVSARFMVVKVEELDPVWVVAVKLCMYRSRNSISMVEEFRRFTLLLMVEKTKLDLIMGTQAGRFPLTFAFIRLLLVREQSDRMTRQLFFRVLDYGLS